MKSFLSNLLMRFNKDRCSFIYALNFYKMDFRINDILFNQMQFLYELIFGGFMINEI